MKIPARKWVRALAFGLSALSTGLMAQQTATPTASTEEMDEDVIELSPFTVEGEARSGYRADTTLAGTRIRTDLRDIASPLSVTTEQFLTDTASRSNQDLLKYTTNTEVGGIYGDYGGFGNGQGASDRSSLLRPNENNRIRGLEQADGTRNFFLSDIPWDSYNTDRIDIQRGPNSILFGVGSPAGIINASTILARMDGNRGKVENQLDGYGSLRFVADYNAEVIDDVLAIRVSGLYDDEKYRQEPAFNLDKRLFGTVTFQPQLLPKDWAGRLRITASYEDGEIEANNPRVLPPEDGVTLWFDDVAGDGSINNPWGMGKGLYDTFLLESGGFGSASRGFNGEVLNPVYVPAYQSIDGGNLNNGGVAMFYNNGESTPFWVSRQAPRSVPGALKADGTVDNAVDGLFFGSLLRGASWNTYSKNIDLIDTRAGRPSRFPLADRNYYKDRSLTDETVFNFYDQLIDGDNKRELSDWNAANFAISQSVLDNRFGAEFVYDRQEYRESRAGVSWERPYISIDANKNFQSNYTRYDRVPNPNGTTPATVLDPSTYRLAGGTPPAGNPRAGSAFVAGGNPANNRNTAERTSLRLTAYAELRASDVFDEESWIAKLIGRNVFTALANTESRGFSEARWNPTSTSYEWARNLSVSGEQSNVNESARGIIPIVYLSGPLTDSSITSAAGLNLPPVTSIYNPSGTYLTDYFDGTWKPSRDPSSPNYVDPGAEWISWNGKTGADASTQSENPLNYIGRTSKPMTVLNADKGDIDQLYHTYNVTDQDIDSIGFTWQGHLLNGDLVPTVGWRRDKLKTYTGAGAKSETGIASTIASADNLVLENEGDTVSWGVVYHLPNAWMENVPVLSGLSLFYNEGNNSKVEARFNFDGQPLDNPSATSTDYGVVFRLLDDKMSIKLNKFRTEVENGNLPGGGSLIGSNQYYIEQLEAWGTACSLIYIFGNAGLDPNQTWHWNWANRDDPTNVPYGIDVNSPEYKNHPSTLQQNAAVADFIAGMDQQFFDNYQIPVDVAKLQAAYNSGDVQQVVSAVSDVFKVGTYTTGLTSQNAGLINGIRPNGTIDSTSEGYEMEFNYAPVPNWNFQINASKTTAYREGLGAAMSEFIEAQHARYQGPAGDIRIWWAGEKPIKRFYEDNIISALRFQEEANGSQAPELRPYRFRAITNYTFTEGFLKNVGVGGAWRWEDNQILGYGLKDDKSGLSVDKPFYSEKQGFVDLWASYNMNLTEKINWRIQLNLRNVGKSAGVTPISANPDGVGATYRITDGMTWALTNTFSF